jgi:hypothetical protein
MSNFERIIPVLTYQDIPAAHDYRWWFATPVASQRQA